MILNFLLLNSDKTAVIVFGLECFKKKLSSSTITLDSISLASGTTGRNLGAHFHQDLSFDLHIKWVSATAFFHLCNIAKIKNIL